MNQETQTPTRSWPELAIGLYDQLTRRNAEITYEFSDMALEVPSGTGQNSQAARWKINGTLKIRTNDASPN